ncbi:hypothetical protein V6N13_022919 [Hibiscus sabdariffa]|uniref:Uncharacterized protein n=2 Tax=Hibiscus sabdariffa TaxID=183260 RepID=A0ABR2P0G9_9ROSI
MSILQKDVDFLRELKHSKPGNSGSQGQELTLSYLCENPKLDLFFEKFSGKTLLEKVAPSQKGKEVVNSENSNQDEKWVEKDFLNLSESKGTASNGIRVRIP